MSDLFELNCSTTLVLGAGTLGAEVAAAGSVEDDGSDGMRLACWSAVHTDAARLIASGLEHKLLLETGPACTGPFAEHTLRRNLVARQDQLSALINARNAVIITGSLHEQSAALLIPALASEIAQRGLHVSVVTLESFSQKGQRLPILADVRVPVIDDGAGGEIAVGTGRRRVQKKLLEVILEMARILAEAPDAQFASEALQETCAGRLATRQAAWNREVESLNF